jgi:hypothetical protein
MWGNGYLLTTPLRTILDLARDNTSMEQLEKAVADAIARGMITARQLKAAA